MNRITGFGRLVAPYPLHSSGFVPAQKGGPKNDELASRTAAIKSTPGLFNGRKLVIATKHGKEKVIAPLLEQALGLDCFVAEDLDTDVLGTFSGEIERIGDSLTTARTKCLMAMELTGCDLAISSEGSFGPHPSLYFVNADEEMLLLVDKRNQLEIVARKISLLTNFSGGEIRTELQLMAFAERTLFPSHALMLRKDKFTNTGMIKGITDWRTLTAAFYTMLKKWGSVYAETDMRALYNPSRRNVIKETAQKLVDKIHSCCPQCSTPGFDVTFTKPGLPCSLCARPTSSVLSAVYTCQKCSYTRDVYYPNKIMAEDPTYCSICNP